MGGFDDTGDGLWFISEHEIKQGFASGGMRAVVVDELGHRDVVSPCFRVGATEDEEICRSRPLGSAFLFLHQFEGDILWIGRFHIQGYD